MLVRCPGVRDRDKRRGGAFVGDFGGDIDAATGEGAGDDSFRRFVGLGWTAVGDGVGRVAAALEDVTDLADGASALEACALDFADRR